MCVNRKNLLLIGVCVSAFILLLHAVMSQLMFLRRGMIVYYEK